MAVLGLLGLPRAPGSPRATPLPGNLAGAAGLAAGAPDRPVGPLGTGDCEKERFSFYIYRRTEHIHVLRSVARIEFSVIPCILTLFCQHLQYIFICISSASDSHLDTLPLRIFRSRRRSPASTPGLRTAGSASSRSSGAPWTRLRRMRSRRPTLARSPSLQQLEF